MKLIKRIRCNLNEAHWIVLCRQIPASNLNSICLLLYTCLGIEHIQALLVTHLLSSAKTEENFGTYLRLLIFQENLIELQMSSGKQHWFA